MSLLHTPYDGSKQPFTVGLEPIEPSRWLEPDSHLVAHLKRKVDLLDRSRDRVFRAEAGTGAAQAEVLELVLQDLREHRGATHAVSGDEVRIAGGPVIRLNRTTPLETASRLVQEDLVLMRESPDGYRLAAASLCFPSSWSLAEKFGKSMRVIHDNVPGFNDGRMGMVVGRLFQNLKPGQLVARYNWSVYGDAELHHPEARQLETQVDPEKGALAHLFIRVERQTLRRMPHSGDILFTIKIHHDPLHHLQSHPNKQALAASLAGQLRALDPDQLAYKGLAAHRETLALALEALACQKDMAG